MVYREPADELARREARAPSGPLLRLDVTGRPGGDGAAGHAGTDGYGSGSDGSRGGDAGPASPGERGGRIAIELRADSRDGVAIARGQAGAPVDAEIGFERPGAIELVACGGAGGDGGIGGRGGDGARGRSGSDATRYSSGGDGGPGGDGGDGGSGTSGAPGGTGGDVLVRVNERDTHLLMLVAHDVRGGKGGSAGRNGAGGSGGPGGRGGSSYSWTESESYTDSNGQSQTRTTHHSNPGGSDGRRGQDGRDGHAALHDGANGPAGTFFIEVTDDAGRVTTKATSRYDVTLRSFKHRNANDDGVYEPEETVFVSHVEIVNTGGMPLPAHHDVVVRLIDDGWIAPAEGQRLVLPRSLAPGETHVFSELELELVLRVFRPQETGAPLAAPETIRLLSELPSVRRRFSPFTTPESEAMGRIVIRFPVEISPITGLYSLAPGQAARVRWSITNVSEKAFGMESLIGRAVAVRLRLEGGELGDDHVLFVDAAGNRVSLVTGHEIEIPHLGPRETRTFEGTIAIAPDAPAYTSARLVASAELGHIASPEITRPIQLQELTVRVGQPFSDRGADVLVVTSNRTTREEVAAWLETFRSLGLEAAVWDASLEGGMRVLDETAAGARSYRLVVMLNDTMDTAAGERRPSVLVDKATVLGLSRAGTHVVYVGRGPGMTELAVPTGAPDEEQAIFRWYLWPWSVAKDAELEAIATSLGEDLSRAAADRRHVVVHRFDPELERKRLWARRIRLGTIEVRRTFDAARGAVSEIEADASEMHDPAFARADATFASTVHSLPFAAKLRLLEQTSFGFGARTAPLSDGCADVFCAAVLLDLLREQRALARFAWNRGASREDLLRAMPMLARLAEDAFTEPIDLASDRGRRFVELFAWLDFAARGHARWFDWIPPLPWLRRGRRLRGVVRGVLASILARACADAKAARAAIDARRRELAKARKESLLRPLPFALDRLHAGLAARKTTSDAEAVGPVRVLTGDEHDAIAKKDGERAERAANVMTAAAAARAELLVPEGYDAIAVRAARAAPPVVEEVLATADDLSALREAR